jgi:hypothetical protein
VIKTERISILFSSLRYYGLMFLCLLSAGVVSATTPNIQGRWEFAVTSGDLSAQVDAMGQSTFSTYLLQSGNSLTNIVAFTTDTVACDPSSNNNVTVANSSIDGQGNVTVIFTVALPDQTSFQFAFTGVYHAGQGGNPTTITGTYQRSSGVCTQGSLGTSNPDGDFTATYFPDLAGYWVGAFDAPNVGTGPTEVAASFTLTTNADKTLSGTVDATGLTYSGRACFSSPVTLQTGMIEGVSYSAGAYFELFGTDTNGTRLFVLGIASNPDGTVAAVGEDNPTNKPDGTVNDGTNNSYVAYYGITGGYCDGLGGGDAPFQLIKSKKQPPKKYDGHHFGTTTFGSRRTRR